MFLFKNRKCRHEYEELGLFYKEYLSEYSNCFDAVVVYRKEKCKKCGYIHDVRIMSEQFLPELHEGRDKRKDAYIEHLKNSGINLELDLYKQEKY